MGSVRFAPMSIRRRLAAMAAVTSCLRRTRCSVGHRPPNDALGARHTRRKPHPSCRSSTVMSSVKRHRKRNGFWTRGSGSGPIPVKDQEVGREKNGSSDQRRLWTAPPCQCTDTCETAVIIGWPGSVRVGGNGRHVDRTDLAIELNRCPVDSEVNLTMWHSRKPAALLI